MERIDLETRIMAREKYFQRSDSEIGKETHQHDINYVRAWENTVGHFKEKYGEFVEKRMLDHPTVQKEFIDKLIEHLTDEAKDLYRRKGNAIADLPKQDDAMIRQGDYLPSEGFLRDVITGYQGNLTPHTYLKEMERWESQRKRILDSAKTEYITDDPEQIKAIFDRYLDNQAKDYVDWDLALRRKEHAIGLLKIIEDKRKVIEERSTGQDRHYDITENDLVVKLHEVWDNEYIIRDERRLKERGLEHPKRDKQSYQEFKRYHAA